jgi:hypothetical protein
VCQAVGGAVSTATSVAGSVLPKVSTPTLSTPQLPAPKLSPLTAPKLNLP